ncbi:MAG: YggT family protein [Actinomycetota bacterium]|nr:YggT family protein [Actinomycetota bacterium]
MDIGDIVCWLLSAFIFLLLVYVVFSWIPRPPEPLLPIVRGIDRIMTPLLEPIRRILPPLRLGGVGLDLSVIVVFFLIAIVQSFLC